MHYTRRRIRARGAQLSDVGLGLQTGFGIVLVELRCTERSLARSLRKLHATV